MVSRRDSLRPLTTSDLSIQKNFVGSTGSSLGVLLLLVKSMIPLAYSYLSVFLIREVGYLTGTLHILIQVPMLHFMLSSLDDMPCISIVNAWSTLEVLFFLFLKLKARYFEALDPLELSLKAAPIMSDDKREELFDRIMSAEQHDPISFIRGWFFDADLETISRYDTLDFLCWSVFDGRNQEHLTDAEVTSLHSFLSRLEAAISNQMCRPFTFTTHQADLAPSDAFTQIYAKALKLGVSIRDAKRAAIGTNEEAYRRVVQKDSALDNFLWKNIGSAKKRFKLAISAKDRAFAGLITSRSRRLKRQLAAYQTLLSNMRRHSSSVSPHTIAHVMSRVSTVHSNLATLEGSARDAYAMSFKTVADAMKPKEPMRYARASMDALFDVSTYPLAAHLAVLTATEVILRYKMRSRGFERYRIGGVSYYVKYATPTRADSFGSEDPRGSICSDPPIVFIHGIGVGLIAYLSLIDKLVATGRPIFLPEISCVTGFRCWETPSSVKGPATVASTIAAMIGSHGYLKATFVGHSYGTSWVSFIAKYTPEFVENLVFLDPICFVLHTSHLVRNFVYTRSDPGSVAALVRTDLMVHFTLQRSFPWVSVALYEDQLPARTVVFFSEEDCLVPSEAAEKYLVDRGAWRGDSQDYGAFLERLREEDDKVTICMLKGMDHGDFLFGGADAQPVIVDAIQAM